MTAATILTVSSRDAAAAVPAAEYKRLLGIPRGREWGEAIEERAELARRWYAQHGRPFVATRRFALRGIGAESVTLETGGVVESAALADRLRVGQAHALIVAAVSAGHEVAHEAARLWADDRPDESYFLDRFAAVVAEQLVWRMSARLCAGATPEGEGLLPHISPGCGRWDLTGQRTLMTLLLCEQPEAALDFAADGDRDVRGRANEFGPGPRNMTLGPITLLDSGALRPQHSLLAALGVTRRAIVATPESSCRSCDRRHCLYRRAAYSRDQSAPGVTE